MAPAVAVERFKKQATILRIEEKEEWASCVSVTIDGVDTGSHTQHS